MQTRNPFRSQASSNEEGFLLVAMIFVVAVMLIFLAVAAPVVAKDLQREKEIEMVHRGNQYVRAIKLYYWKNNKQYPPSIDALVQSNNIRFLRKKYVDPMTGKDDWRIIHLGVNKTTVTGFFGEPLAGLTTTGAGGLGSANGMVSSVGDSGAAGSTAPTAPGSTSASGSGSTGSSGTTGSTGSTGGVGSTDATTFNGSGGGPIIGVSSLSPKQAIISIRKQTTFDTWEFIYDPRIELLYAKANILGGGVGSASPTSTGLNGLPGASSPGGGTGPSSGTGPQTSPTPGGGNSPGGSFGSAVGGGGGSGSSSGGGNGP